MKRSVIYLFGFIILSSFTFSKVSAQNYGYKGRAFSLYYTFHTMSALSSPTWSDFQNRVHEDDVIKNFKKFNTRHAIWGEYVINRIRSAGVKYQYFTTAIDPVFVNDNYPMGIINQSFGIFFRMYKDDKGALAPIGHYHQFDFMMINSKVVDANLLEETTVIEKFNWPGIAYTFGNQIILFDRLITDIGFQIGAPVDFTILNDSYDSDSELKNKVYTRLVNHMLFNINLTVGLNLL